MRIETDGGDTWQYGDQETYEDVLECFNQGEVHKEISGVLIKQAEDLYDKLEENYVKAEGPAEKGPSYPKASDFSDEESGSSRLGGDTGAGRALKALAEMEITNVDIWSEEGPKYRYDFTEVNYEDLCGVLEAVTRIDDEDLDWNSSQED